MEWHWSGAFVHNCIVQNRIECNILSVVIFLLRWAYPRAGQHLNQEPVQIRRSQNGVVHNFFPTLRVTVQTTIRS